MYNGDYFSGFDEYLFDRVNTKTIQRIRHITHVNSEYVNAMQLSDLVSGAIKDYFTGKNKDLRKVIEKKYLYKIWQTLKTKRAGPRPRTRSFGTSKTLTPVAYQYSDEKASNDIHR